MHNKDEKKSHIASTFGKNVFEKKIREQEWIFYFERQIVLKSHSDYSLIYYKSIPSGF